MADGLVARLPRPDGKVTRHSVMNPEPAAQRLQMPKGTVRGLARIARLLDTGFPR